jgi:prepilin-type processing-associated H-X9-DG protein
VLLLNNYEISKYMNILFGDNHVQRSWNWKKRDALRYHPGIINLIRKDPVDYFPPKHVTVKNIHIDIIALNYTNFYRRIFKIFKIMFFMDGTQTKWYCRGNVLHTHPLLFLYLWGKKTSYQWQKAFDCHSGWTNYQITAIVFFILRSVGEGEGGLSLTKLD